MLGPDHSPGPQQRGRALLQHPDRFEAVGAGEEREVRVVVARLGGLSADHVEYADEAGAAALGLAGTVAVLLPGAFYFLREQQRPPVDALRRHGVRMALATDFNPGSSPLLSPRLIMNMACTLFRLTPAEALAGPNATEVKRRAQALGF